MGARIYLPGGQKGIIPTGESWKQFSLGARSEFLLSELASIAVVALNYTTHFHTQLLFVQSSPDSPKKNIQVLGLCPSFLPPLPPPFHIIPGNMSVSWELSGGWVLTSVRWHLFSLTGGKRKTLGVGWGDRPVFLSHFLPGFGIGKSHPCLGLGDIWEVHQTSRGGAGCLSQVLCQRPEMLFWVTRENEVSVKQWNLRQFW